MKLSNGLNTLFLEMIGSGKQGIVYKINSTQCVKVYNKKKYCHRELKALQKGKESDFFPKIFQHDDNYIVRELIQGEDLKHYLQKNHMTRDIAHQIIRLFHTLDQLGFKRLDIRLPHLFLTPEKRLKLIDPTNMVKHHRKYPRKMLSGLEKLDEKDTFLNYVKELDPSLYHKWQKYFD